MFLQHDSLWGMPLNSVTKPVEDIEKALLKCDYYNLGVTTVFLSYLLKQCF